MKSTILKGFKCYTEQVSIDNPDYSDDNIEEEDNLWKDAIKDAYNSEDEDSPENDKDEYALNVPNFLDYEVFPEPQEIV